MLETVFPSSSAKWRASVGLRLRFDRAAEMPHVAFRQVPSVRQLNNWCYYLTDGRVVVQIPRRCGAAVGEGRGFVQRMILYAHCTATWDWVHGSFQRLGSWCLVFVLFVVVVVVVVVVVPRRQSHCAGRSVACVPFNTTTIASSHCYLASDLESTLLLFWFHFILLLASFQR